MVVLLEGIAMHYAIDLGERFFHEYIHIAFAQGPEAGYRGVFDMTASRTVWVGLSLFVHMSLTPHPKRGLGLGVFW